VIIFFADHAKVCRKGKEQNKVEKKTLDDKEDVGPSHSVFNAVDDVEQYLKEKKKVIFDDAL
jgi:hypothetical protein